MMKQIAIIKSDVSYSGYDDYTKIIESITDWSEVTDEEFKLLKDHFVNHDYQIIERVDTSRETVIRLVSQALEIAQEKKAKADAKAAAAREKKIQRDLQRQAKIEADEKKLLDALKAKYEMEGTE